MATYGAPESNPTEGMAVGALFIFVGMWVAGWAYADGILQILLVLVGLAGTAASGYLMALSRKPDAPAK